MAGRPYDDGKEWNEQDEAHALDDGAEEYEHQCLDALCAGVTGKVAHE